MSLQFEPVLDADRDSVAPTSRVHGPNERCPFVADDYQWEVAAGTCCRFDMSDAIARLREESSEVVELLVRGPRHEEIPVVTQELYAWSKEYQANAGDEGEPGHEEALENIEAVEVAAEWLEQCEAASFGVRHVVNA